MICLSVVLNLPLSARARVRPPPSRICSFQWEQRSSNVGSDSSLGSFDDKKEPISVDEYLARINEHGVSPQDIQHEYMAREGYKEWIPGNEDDAEKVELQGKGVNITLDDAYAALLSASVANFFRMTYANIDDENCAGYLFGSQFDKNFCVNRTRSVHSPLRLYDLNTLFMWSSTKNTLVNNLGLTFEQATTCLEEGSEDEAVDVAMLVLMNSILVRMLGRPFAMEQWGHHRNREIHKSHANPGTAGSQNPAAAHVTIDSADAAGASSATRTTPIPSPNTDSVDRSMPYLPGADQEELKSFTDFIIATCTEANGTIQKTLLQWLGQGDAASIPKELKSPRSMTCFFTNMLTGPLRPLAVNIVRIIRDDKEGKRERAVSQVSLAVNGLIRGLLESNLKPNQVRSSTRHIVSMSFHFMLLVVLTDSVYFRLCLTLRSVLVGFLASTRIYTPGMVASRAFARLWVAT